MGSEKELTGGAPVAVGVVAVLRDVPPWVRWLVAGQFVSALGSLTWLFLTLYLVSDRGLDVGPAGLAAGAYGVGVIAGNLLGGSAGDRWGVRRTVVLVLTVAALAKLGLPVLPTSLLVVVSALGGLAGGAARPLLNALVAAELPSDRRREGIALSRAASNAGTVIGPPLAAVLSVHWFGLVFVVDGLSTLVLVLVIARVVPRGPVPARVLTGSLWGAITRDQRLRRLLLGIVVVDTVYRLMYTVLPIQLRDSGSAPITYGLLISLNAVVIVILEAPIALRLRDRPAVGVIGAGFVLVGAGYLTLAVSTAAGAAVMMMLVVTAGEMLYKPTATAYAADLAPEGMAARYQSAYAAASISGTLLSPVIGSWVYEVWPPGVWLAAAAAAVGAGLWFRRVGTPESVTAERAPAARSQTTSEERRAGEPDPSG
jgi:MFS family permease